jgi:hypothetical protein
LADQSAVPAALFAIRADFVVAGGVFAGQTLHRLHRFQHDQDVRPARVDEILDHLKRIHIRVQRGRR